MDVLSQHKGLQIHAWVILDNHFHASVRPDLTQVMRDFKRFTAQRILDQLRTEDSEYPVAISNDEIMLQKLEYLHNNPVRATRRRAEYWRYPRRTSNRRRGAVLRCDPGAEVQLQGQVRSGSSFGTRNGAGMALALTSERHCCAKNTSHRARIKHATAPVALIELDRQAIRS